MRRVLLLLLLLLVVVCLPADAQAKNLGICAVAKQEGGPCGCIASIKIFGHSIQDLWEARMWYKFPRTLPHPGAVAVWRSGHHVEAVIDVHGGRVITDGLMVIASSIFTR
jgi:hypothetical protein